MKAYNDKLNTQFRELFYKIRAQTLDDSGVDNSKLDDSLKKEVETSAQLAVNEEMFSFALQFYEIVDNKEKQLETANMLVDLKQGDSMDAIRTFTRLKKRPELLKVIHLLEDANIPVDYSLGPVEGYVGNDLTTKIYNGFKTWHRNLGIVNAYTLGIYQTANLAYNLALSSQFDIGVAIAKGGLELAYLFELFGMDVKIIEAHKRGLNVSFNWVTQIKPNDFNGKKVLVFDKDVVSGRTSRRVAQEIGRYNPSSISLCLYHSPVGEERKIGTISKNIPKEYAHTYYPTNFRYRNIDTVVEHLESSLSAFNI